jgi:transcriptional regulator with XRE-family HTH domain
MRKSTNAKILRTENIEQLEIFNFNRRLRFVRESLGISRYEVERVTKIDESTLRKIENNSNDYVPSDILIKLYSNFEQFKQYVDPMWLIYNRGDPPDFINKISFKFSDESSSSKLKDNAELEEKNIIFEVLNWQQLYENSIYLKSFKDFFIPNFKKNDYICGLFFDKNQLIKLKPIDVLISTNSNSGLEPYHFLKFHNDEGIFIQSNEFNEIDTKVIKLDEIDRIAKIVLHRKSIYK